MLTLRVIIVKYLIHSLSTLPHTLTITTERFQILGDYKYRDMFNVPVVMCCRLFVGNGFGFVYHVQYLKDKAT